MFKQIFGRASEHVEVQIVDADGGQQIGLIKLKVGDLPARFEGYNTIDMSGSTWEVVEAQPPFSKDFAKTRKLTLKVRRLTVQTLKEGDLLYSLPTISNDLPRMAEESTKIGKHTLELHEDDWRQIELVARQNQDGVTACLSAIRTIHENYRLEKSGAFSKMHVRREIPSPLKSTALTYELLIEYVKPLKVYDGISFSQVAGMVEMGFAFLSQSGNIFYGLKDGDGTLSIVGLVPGNAVSERIAEPSDVPSITALIEKQSLLLVDWCSMKVAPDEQQISEFLY